MSSMTRLNAIATAVALALGGTAMANTSLNTNPGTSDLFLNLVDTSNGASFVFDTGIEIGSFNGNTNQSFNLTSDTNYTSFLTAAGTDVLDYSVVAATTNVSVSPKTEAVDFTVQTGTPSNNVTHSSLTVAVGTVTGFVNNANNNNVGPGTATTNSAQLTASNGWGQSQYEGNFQGSLGFGQSANPYGDAQLLGTAMAFYQESAVGSLSSTTLISTLSAYAGQWNFSGGSLTYTAGGSQVPLPMPLVLLLSGLGTMGIMARRGKAATDKGMLGSAAG